MLLWRENKRLTGTSENDDGQNNKNTASAALYPAVIIYNNNFQGDIYDLLTRRVLLQ